MADAERPRRRRLAALLEEEGSTSSAAVAPVAAAAPGPAADDSAAAVAQPTQPQEPQPDSEPIPTGAHLIAEIAATQAGILKLQQQMHVALSRPYLSDEGRAAIHATAADVLGRNQARLATLTAYAQAVGARVPDLLSTLAVLGGTPSAPGEPARAAAAGAGGTDVAAAAAAAVAGLGAGGAGAAPAPENPARIYIGSLPLEGVNEAVLRTVFSPFGAVVRVEVPLEPSTGRARGFAFLTFDSVTAASAAIEHMNGFELGGRQIKVSRPTSGGGGSAGVAGEAGAAVAAGAVAGGPGEKPAYRVYVGNVPYEMTADHLRVIFAPFGTIRSCSLLASQLPPTTPGAPPGHRGYGFIEFEEEGAARAAITNMHGFDLGGRKLKVSVASGVGPTGSTAAAAPAAAGALPGAAGAAAPAAPLPPTTLLMDPFALSAASSRVLALSNMVAAGEVDEELSGEVADEAGRYGAVERCYIHIHEPRGDPEGRVTVFLVFATPADAAAAFPRLDRRPFGRRITSATYYPEAAFAAGRYE